ncbi:endolytic transglycosylase MltG [Leptospira sp. GIMC2001]|nr:endolytic transglycosylase MltG [Leptospira sp. GIMC2001]WCL51410.1 endolytic transglycosylase MltG [Leptospira sp. GIMC2001]
MNILQTKLFRYLIVGFIVIVLGVISSLAIIDEMKGGAVGDGQVKYDLIIDPGMSSSKVTQELSTNGLIKSSVYFKYLLRFTRSESKIKSGVYEINDGMTSRKILQVLVDGKVKLVHFTIPEGYNNRQIGDILVKKNLVKTRQEFLLAAQDKKLLDKYKIPGNSLEGYLFPETYSVPINFPLDRILEMMIRRFYVKLEKIEESKNLSPADLHTKVILASIVEREAVRPNERPMMAGVFETRIDKDMPLESCATVQYLFDKPKKRLFEKDIKIDSPYNTYINPGWPPGPISNPGFPALEAAFRPQKSNKLFFLLKPDGSHYFSETFKEHLEAKKKYIDVLYKN